MIRLKSNAQLQQLAKEYHPATEPLDISKTECYFEETIYQAKSWPKPRKVIIQSVRPARLLREKQQLKTPQEVLFFRGG